MGKLREIEVFEASDGSVLSLFSSGKGHVVQKIRKHKTIGTIVMKNAVEWDIEYESDAITEFQRVCKAHEIFFSKLPTPN
jgi:hypothetical protein